MNDTPRNPGLGADEPRGPANPDMAALSDAKLQLNQAGEARMAAVLNVARFHGVEMDLDGLRLRGSEAAPPPPELVVWLKEAGLWARGVQMNFRQIMNMESPSPIILLLDDGGAALLVGRDRGRGVLVLRDPRQPTSAAPVLVDELRLKQVWSGATLLIRSSRHGALEEQPFNLGMIARIVWGDAKILRDIAITSVTLTVLSLVPILVVMRIIGVVIQFHSTQTLNLVIILMLVAVLFEAMMTWSRKMMEVVLAAKLDAKLNLMIFDRLVALPIEFFEREQAGQISYKISQVNRVRDFLTGKLMNAFIDVFMLILLLPILFYMSAPLAWTILIAAALIAAIIAVFLRPIGILIGKVIAAESAKGSILIETVFGIRTVKALALENTPRHAMGCQRRRGGGAECRAGAHGQLAGGADHAAAALLQLWRHSGRRLHRAAHPELDRQRQPVRLHAAGRPRRRPVGQPRRPAGRGASGPRLDRSGRPCAEPAK
ncbi:ABC transporter transmembrane domain-containing protein [Acidocella sp. MX-AZ02]|uniref:ABC transporter transmembrane domain-containing protein n=1 Tax=Acidocella sp. MX-AZ02 TaxID=1214225 RepID=UPI001F0A0174|nr:ABC transporter transmembrane domain-containing protein [Acidocella sp. MX-AZ02]